MGATAILVIAGLATLFGAVSYREHETALRDASRITDNLLRALDEHTRRVVQGLDQELSGVSEGVLMLEQTGASRAFDAYRLLGRRVERVPQIHRLLVVDGAGILRYSSESPVPPPEDYSADEAFSAHRDEASESLFIGVPAIDPGSGRWLLPMSRAFHDPDGALGGVLIAYVDLETFLGFYRELDVGENSVIAVYRRDGPLLVRRPMIADLIGGDASGRALFRDHLPQAEAGFYHSTRSADGLDRWIGFRNIDGLPLVAVVGLDSREVLAAWLANVWSYVLAVGIFIVMVSVLGCLLVRQWRHREAQAAALRAAKAQAEQANERLTERNEQFDVALDNMTHGLVLHDRAHRLLVYNRRFLELFKLSAETLRPGVTRDEIIDHLIAREAPSAGDERILREKQHRVANSARRRVFHLRLADGTLIEGVHQPLLGWGAVQTFTDVTRRERTQHALRESQRRARGRVDELEEIGARLQRQGEELAALAADLARARDEAEAASRTKSAFLANMSHELRTPLNAIIGFSEVMKDEVFGQLGNQRYREYARDVHDSGIHLLALINEILDLAKVESGHLELREAPVDVAQVIAACYRLMKERAATAQVALKVAPTAPLPVLRADELRVKQVLLNLLSNAIKFTPSGGTITVTAELERDGALAISVRDTGIGMRAEDIPLALQPFGQIDDLLDRRHQGTGLGLPLAKALIELHGGTLALESVLGHGTRVVMRFPAERSEAAALPLSIAPAGAD